MRHFIHQLFLLGTTAYHIPSTDIVPTTTSTVGGAITNAIKLLLELIGMLAVVFIVVGGLLMTLSAGNPARVKQAREAVIYAVVGLAVAIGAYAVVTFLTSKAGT